MRIENPTSVLAASWELLEGAIQRLHAAARSPIAVRDFYRQLVAEAAEALASPGAVAWRARPDGRPELLARLLADPGDAELLHAPPHAASIAKALAAAEPVILPADGEFKHELLLQPVALPPDLGQSGSVEEPAVSAAPGASPGRVVALVELWLAADSAPQVRQGALDFAAALADVAADFHAWDELRRLRGAAAVHGQAVDLVRRIHAARDLNAAVFELANEGRRLLSIQRLTVLLRRGGHLRVAAVSGSSRVDRSTDFARRSEDLASQVARWGEPVDYSTQPSTSSDSPADLPPHLQAAIEAHVDHSHARRLVAAPLFFSPDETSRRAPADAVLIAERFDAPGDAVLVSQLAQLAEVCAPALRRAAELDRFPVRTLLSWSERLRAFREPRRAVRGLLITGSIAAVLASLFLIKADFTVEAPATLAAAVERQVFATATGAVAEVRVAHGDMVEQGQTLVVLRDPELALKLQQVRGEIAAVRERLAAVAVSRTDRALRENDDDHRLPLSAEQRELEERLASLDLQQKLLEARRDDLEIRSPVAGQVLTRDVQSLLASRPVERGQTLLTIADSSTGWELRADVPQRKIGHVLDAQRRNGDALAVDYRLAGDVSRSYPGRVVAVSAAAPLDAEGLGDPAPPVEVRIALEGEPPSAVRSGMTASVRIHCGQRSLAYIWLYDPAATLYRWFTF